MDFAAKTIVIGIGGGIAAYRACDLIRELYRRGAKRVITLMTPDAAKFITPLTLKALSHEDVYIDPMAVDELEIPLHIAMAQQADAFLILPATCNLIAKLANGLADDLVSTTAMTFTGKPVILAPAMNTRMWHHPITQRNLETLRTLPNLSIIEPIAGYLACGETGDGHLADQETILHALYREIHPKALLLNGQRVLITAGGTQEPIDPVRLVTNRSSGKMGIALADECHAMGAEVTLIGTLQALTLLRASQGLQKPYTVVPVQTADQLLQAVDTRFDQTDVFIMAAAVSDFTVANPTGRKIKRVPNQPLTLTLSPTPDILEAMASRKRNQVVIGFAAESENLAENAQHKLRRKKVDAIVVNDISRPDIGFNSDENEVLVFFKNGEHVHLRKAPKAEIARGILDQVYKQCLAPAFQEATLKKTLLKAVQKAL